MDLMSYLTGNGAAFMPSAADTQRQLNWRPKSAYMTPAQPKKAGLLGVDPMTWLQIAGAMAQGAQGGGWGAALQGTAGAFQDMTGRRDQASQSDAQRRAMIAMQAGDMDGALRILSSAKGLEGQALSAQMALKQREQERQDELSKPIIAAPGARGLRRNEAGGYDEIFNVPDPSAVPPGSRVHSGYVTPEGRVAALMSDASTKLTDITAADTMRTVDVGGVPVVLSGRSGAAAPVSVGGGAPGQARGAAAPITAQDVGQNKAQIEDIVSTQKAATQAKVDLPSALETARVTLDVMNQLKTHEGFDKRYGLESLGGIMPAAPGGKGADAQALIEQVTGQAFLTAIETLRGTGPITEREGAAATAAVTRLKNQAQSPPAAKKALDELMVHVANMRMLAMLKAGQPLDYSNLSDSQLELLQSLPPDTY